MIQIQDFRVDSRSGQSLVEISEWKVNPGEFWAILGPNGSGKSTLLQAITGLLTIVNPDLRRTGRVLLGGKELESLSITEISRRAVLMGSHDPRAFAMSVQESISLGGGRGALSAPEALCALREFALLGLLERDIRELSQGQLQLAALVRHLVQDPSVLLIDEGLSSVDIDLQIRATRYLSHWALQSQKAVLLVAHDLRLALRHATHVLIIHQGKKIWSGAKSDLSWRNALGLAYPHVDSGLLD